MNAGRGLLLTLNYERFLSIEIGLGFFVQPFFTYVRPTERGTGDGYLSWPGLTIGGVPNAGVNVPRT